MIGHASAPAPTARKIVSVPVVFFVFAVVVAASVYANLSFFVTDPHDYRQFPPFEPYLNLNMNDHLGGENWNVARALAAGEGFANPFEDRTGPTAWMPPIYPMLLAGLLWICDGSRDAVMVVVILLQVCVLAGTGVLVAALARRTIAWNVRLGNRTFDLSQAVTAVVFALGVLSDFFLFFQFTHDVWLVLLILDLLVVGFFWGRPLQSAMRAAGWGFLGGVCALTNPIVAFVWGILSVCSAARQRTWSCLVVACLAACVTVAPWMVRNYLVFGCLIPVKSNANYELYQSQCLTTDGVVVLKTFDTHPYTAPGPERQKYGELGEIAYLQRKGALFRQAVQTDPVSFLSRLGWRFVAVTLWYEPFSTIEQEKIPDWVMARRLTHPLPFLAWSWLLVSALWQRLHPIQWIAVGMYFLYLMPYVSISYYDRYAAPLIGVKILLVVWAIDHLLSLRQRRSSARACQRAIVEIPIVHAAKIECSKVENAAIDEEELVAR